MPFSAFAATNKMARGITGEPKIFDGSCFSVKKLFRMTVGDSGYDSMLNGEPCIV